MIQPTNELETYSPGPAWVVALGMLIVCAFAFAAGAWAAYTILTH